MTNLEWLVQNRPEIIIKSLSTTYTAIKIDKNTGVIGKCDDVCCSCLFSDQNGTSEDCVYRITEWLEAEHKDKKQIKNLTDDDIDKICCGKGCCNCILNIGSGYYANGCYANIKRYIKNEWGLTISELAEFENKVVEV